MGIGNWYWRFGVLYSERSAGDRYKEATDSGKTMSSGGAWFYYSLAVASGDQFIYTLFLASRHGASLRILKGTGALISLYLWHPRDVGYRNTCDAMTNESCAADSIVQRTNRNVLLLDCMTSWVVLRHMGTYTFGWFIGRRVFRSKGWHLSKPNISWREYSVVQTALPKTVFRTSNISTVLSFLLITN